MTPHGKMTGHGGTGDRTDVLAVAALMRRSLRGGAVRRMAVPLREVVEDGHGTRFLSMPAVSADLGLCVNKTATITDGPGPTVTSVVPVFSTATGDLLDVLDGALVTDLKCAAVTALVTDCCAAPDATSLAIIGSGVQAWQQYLGVSAVRPITDVRIHSRTAAHADVLCARVRRADPSARVRVCASAREATEGADVISTATTSVRPLPIAARLAPHVHINCMGAHTTDSREVSRTLMERAALVVEDIEIAVAEAGEIHRGAIDLESLVSGDHTGLPGRTTVFSSTGHASLDLITCAHLVTRQASTTPKGRPYVAQPGTQESAGPPDAQEAQLASADREFTDALARRDIVMPPDLAPGVLAGARSLRAMSELLRAVEVSDV
ncbi:ornithine cyclodeaminase family protein [Streptomyces sp. NPDC006711]|uniref:ornithine cyclodeaminase family protein n=1 Tax=unclassified Streptomyces TaxID=2593676 RepID=UPI003697722D